MFSPRTIFEIVKSLHFKTYDEVDRFVLEFGIADKITGRYLKERETSIARLLIEAPDAHGPNSSNLPIEIIEHAIRQSWSSDSFIEDHVELRNSLERDGFCLTKSGIQRRLPEELPVAAQESELVASLKTLGLETALGHYEQAVAAHARGEWAGSNAQLRAFVEDVFDRAQTIVCPGEYPSSHARREALARSGFFHAELNEYLFNGKGFVEGFWKRLHPSGSHPGLSDEADATFRLHLVILVVHFFLERLRASIS